MVFRGGVQVVEGRVCEAFEAVEVLDQLQGWVAEEAVLAYRDKKQGYKQY